MKLFTFAKSWKLSFSILIGGFGISVANAAATASPVGTWDCLSSGGGQSGIAFLSFTSNSPFGGTFTGFQFLVGKSKSSSNGDGRNPGGGDGRGDSDSNTNSTTSNTILFGFDQVSGPWQYDAKGRIMGFFIEIVNATSSITTYSNYCPSNISINYFVTNNTGDVIYPAQTNFFVPCFTNQTLVVTNTWTDISTNDGTLNFYSRVTTISNPNFTVTVGSAESTNAVSFTGKVVANKRLTLVASTSLGKVTYSSVPFKTNLMDLTGSWYGTKKVNKQSIIQFFDLIPSIMPNLYEVTNGVGPGYTFDGVAILSSQKKIGFAFTTASDVLSAVTGSFSAAKKPTKASTASTKGIEQPGTAIKFEAVFPPAP